MLPMEGSCVIHQESDTEPGRVNAVGDDVLFRIRLAYQDDEATLDKLVGGAGVCRTCCSRAMRILEKRFGKSWKSQVYKRRQEQQDAARAAAAEAAKHPSKRVREEEAGLRFVPASDGELFHVSPHEGLAQLFQWPALYELNARFALLGYPPMLAGPDLLLHEALWRGLSSVVPECARRAAELVRRDRQAAPEEVWELMCAVPPRAARVVAAMANFAPRPQNAPLTRAFVELLCRAWPPDAAPLPVFFGRPLAESQMERILAAVAMSPFLEYEPDAPTAVLWTVDFDPPALVSLAGAAQLPATCLALREALSAKTRIPPSHLRLSDPLSGAAVELQTLVAAPLLHFLVSAV